ncbi:NAD(P)-dependent oxidoreductase [Brucella intermedia]|uniref:NAD(P)-dependent oxidoreductase n=1 Tax=Brucella intermedia TaxID=94625 RepID=UPI00224B6B69|nr:SDR family oxidoreductase [Brucella intermedia]
MKILVIGATGGTGRQIVQEALAKGYEVNALVRSVAKTAPLLAGADLIQGDALDPVATADALKGCDGVISSLGPRLSPWREVTLLSAATRVLIDEMKKQSIKRLVCITGMGAGDSRGHGGFFYDRIFQPLLLGPIYRDKDRQEAEIRVSGLDWTIVRPAVLTDGPAHDNAVRAMTDLKDFHGGKISRANVARFVVDEFNAKRWIGKAPLISE